MTASRNALIVDDERDIRELLVLTLGRMGLRCDTAASLADARALLRQNRYALCLTDMRLADGSGLDLVREIAQLYSETPVAMITAFGNQDAAVGALKAGAFDFVSKPVDLAVLRGLVQHALKLGDEGRKARIDAPDPISRAADIAGQDRVSTLGFTVAAILIALALINATVAAVFAAHDHARNHAIMRTIGTTPGQTVTAFLAAQLTACLLACVLGIPLGIAFYESSTRGPLGPIGLSALTYVGTILAALTLYALISAIPARLLARRPITPQLTYE